MTNDQHNKTFQQCLRTTQYTLKKYMIVIRIAKSSI